LGNDRCQSEIEYGILVFPYVMFMGRSMMFMGHGQQGLSKFVAGVQRISFLNDTRLVHQRRSVSSFCLPLLPGANSMTFYVSDRRLMRGMLQNKK
jgi:hypothetical protein